VFSLSWCVLSRSRSVLYMNLWGCLTSTRFSRALKLFLIYFFNFASDQICTFCRVVENNWCGWSFERKLGVRTRF
jgi:hypothetical protein